MKRCPFCNRQLQGLSALLEPYKKLSTEELQAIIDNHWTTKIEKFFKKCFKGAD